MSSTLYSVQAAIREADGVISDFLERVCTGCPLLMYSQATSYRDHFYTVLADAQGCGKYLGPFQILVSKDGHQLNVVDADSDQELAGRTSPPGADSDVLAVVPSLVKLKLVVIFFMLSSTSVQMSFLFCDTN